jgi:hypothetical protein
MQNEFEIILVHLKEMRNRDYWQYKDDILEILQETIMNILKGFAPKLYSYRFETGIIKHVGESYMNHKLDKLLVKGINDYVNQQFNF